MAVALLATLSIGVSSCSDDDNDGPGSTSLLIGTWQTVTINTNETDQTPTEDVAYDNYRISFYEDGTFKQEKRNNSSSPWHTFDEGYYKYTEEKIYVDYNDGFGWEVIGRVLQLSENALVIEDKGYDYEDGYWYYKATLRRISAD